LKDSKRYNLVAKNHNLAHLMDNLALYLTATSKKWSRVHIYKKFIRISLLFMQLF